jgi:proteasome assembly chaperone (PAC2) family protein
MEHVRWRSQPTLREPVLIAAFEGWNDAGDAASLAATWFRDRCASKPVADIDPEVFFDFTSTRPQVRLDEHEVRHIEWPANELTAGNEIGRDLVILIGNEPQLRWRTFCEHVVGVARALDVQLVVLLGALLAEVPHSRPINVHGTSTDPAMASRLGLAPSLYEGPTGIVGVLADACRREGIPSLSLWASVPAYVPGAPSPKAALALVERLAGVLDVPINPLDLQIASAAYERQVNEVVEADEETRDYVEALEEAYEEGGDDEPVSLVEEVERFLRDQGA